jgi:hypothetical protein
MSGEFGGIAKKEDGRVVGHQLLVDLVGPELGLKHSRGRSDSPPMVEKRTVIGHILPTLKMFAQESSSRRWVVL